MNVNHEPVATWSGWHQPDTVLVDVWYLFLWHKKGKNIASKEVLKAYETAKIT